MERNQTIANRGANGIDGVVSTALGVSTVSKNTVLAIGDLSFFHDMNGLLAAKLQKQNITILLVNNDGGGIFSSCRRRMRGNISKRYSARLMGLIFHILLSFMAVNTTRCKIGMSSRRYLQSRSKFKV